METQTIKQFKQTTNDAINKDSNSSKSKLSVIESNAKIAKLTKLLQDNAKLEQVNITPELKDSRDRVIACLKDNQGKSLNCWDEVETFKTLVRNL